MNRTKSSNSKSVAHQTLFRKLPSWSHEDWVCLSFDSAFSSSVWPTQIFCQVLHSCFWAPSSAALGNMIKIYQVGFLIFSPGWKLSAVENFTFEYIYKKKCACHLEQKVVRNAMVCNFSANLFHILIRVLSEPNNDNSL